MNNYFIYMLGLSLMVPTFVQPTVKNKAKAIAKITCALLTTVAAGIIFYNITKTAQRRLANPEYTGSRSPAAILKQIGMILWNQKPLSIFVIANVATAGIALCSAVEDIKFDNQKDLINK